MTASALQGVTHACFGLSYLAAFGLELARLFWPRPVWRPAALGLGLAGLFAHSLYLLLNPPDPAAPFGALLLLAWVLALFYLYGTVHYARQAWAVFVLPVVLLLVGLSFAAADADPAAGATAIPGWLTGERFWGGFHGSLILMAAVGVSVAFLAGVMYLVQARRLRRKVNPARVVPLLSLERLDAMSRRAVTVAFPLLTAGLLLGTVLPKHGHGTAGNWLSVKVLSTAGLWVVFLVLVYLRYASHVPPRRLAALSVVAFVLMLVALGAAHPFAERDGP